GSTTDATGARARPWCWSRTEHFPEKACPGLDPGWTPVFRQKMRHQKNLEVAMAEALHDTLGVKRAIKHFDFSEPYWEGTRQKKLVIQYCKVTGKYQHFPRPVSIFTGRRRDIEWREVSGKGVMFSWTITH